MEKTSTGAGILKPLRSLHPTQPYITSILLLILFRLLIIITHERKSINI